MISYFCLKTNTKNIRLIPNVSIMGRHLSKNFDNVHNLKFVTDEAGEPTKRAIGMYSGAFISPGRLHCRPSWRPSQLAQASLRFISGEGEYVQFASECVCDGPVEVWLQHVVDAMRAALSAEFKAAIAAYDEKPRGKWIFDFSAQNTVVASRTFFTADVNAAFEDLEEGNEDALKVRCDLVYFSHTLLCAFKRYSVPVDPRYLCQVEYDKQVAQLAELITIINGKLTPNERKKLITPLHHRRARTRCRTAPYRRTCRQPDRFSVAEPAAVLPERQNERMPGKQFYSSTTSGLPRPHGYSDALNCR